MQFIFSPIIGSASDHFGRRPVILASNFGLGFDYILMALWGIANPSIQSMMSHRIHASEQGQLQGALGSMRVVNGMIGPLLFTQVFALAVRHGGEPVLARRSCLPLCC